MTEVRIVDELRIGAPIDAVWHTIEDPVAHARWHPFVIAIDGGHGLYEIRSCSVQVGKKEGTTRERCVEREERGRIVWTIEEDSTGFGRMVSGWRSTSASPSAAARRSSARRARSARAICSCGRCSR
jgi:hypothetical protein